MADALPPSRIPASKWHGDKPDPVQSKRGPNRGRRLFWLTALLLALLGTVLAIFLYPSTMTAPRFLTMTVREYQSPLLPPNAWTLQDGQLLASHFDKDKIEGAYDKQNLDQFRKFLDRLENWNDGPLVVHLGALGRVYDGEVVLFLGDTNPDEPSRGVKLDSVIKHMKSKYTSDKLLLLDLARPAADVRLGVLANDLAEAVHRQLVQAELPFFVLTACSPGQMSYVSEELGASAFAYYLDLGMRGFAEQTPDQRITVSELASFVKKQVDRWVWVNRGHRQEPRLYGKAKDFPLKQLGSEPPELPEASKEKTYPPWLKAGWRERDALYRDGSYRRAPWAFRQLEIALASSEKRWRSGEDDNNRLAPDLARTVANFKDAIVKARDAAPPNVFSLAEIRDAKTDQLAKDFQIKLDRYLDKVPDPDMKAEEGDKVRLEEAKKIKADLIEQIKALKSFNAGAAVIVAAAARPINLSAGRINALADLLGEIRLSSLDERRFAETVYLERLKDLIERVRENAEWQGPVAHLALRIALQTEEVFAELGRTPSGLDPWNKSLLAQGEEHRQRGDKDLFTGAGFAWREAPAAYRQAEQALRDIPLRLEILRLIEESRDQAFVHLPGWAPFVIALPRVDPQEEASWKAGVLAARDLADLLEKKNIIALAGEPTSLFQWQNFASQWQKSIDARIDRLERIGDEGRAAEYLEWTALLESSRLPAEQREKIWASARKLGLKLHQKAAPPDATDADVAALGIVPGDDPAARQEKDREGRRRRLVKDFLDVAAYQWPEAPEQAAAPKDAGDPKEGHFTADKLQKTLAKDVPGQFYSYAKGSDKLAERLVKADRLSRIFPEVLSLRSSGADFSNSKFRNPALSLHNLNQITYWSFMRDRYRRETQDLRSQKSRHEDFYAVAAEAYARVLP